MKGPTDAKRRILLISQWWQPEPTFKGMPFALALRDRGYEVEVLTGFPNWPGGRVYPGYSIKPWQRERMSGIPIVRTALYPSHGASGLKRMASYLSFALSSFFFAPLLLRKADLIYVFNLVTLGPTALLLKTLYRCPVVYDITDLWPDSVVASGMIPQRWLQRLLANWCRFLYRRLDRIVVTSPGYGKILRGLDVPGEKIEEILNWDPGENEPSDPPDGPMPLAADRFNILYAGNLGKAQALETVLQAAGMIKDECRNVHFTLIGAGVEAEGLRGLAAERHLTNVTFLPWVPRTQIRNYFGRADALLVHLRDDPIFRSSIPSKTQTYLAAGRPILMGVRGETAELVRRAGAGLAFEPENAASLVESIKVLRKMDGRELAKMGRNGMAFYRETMSFPAALEKFVRLFESLAPPGRAPKRGGAFEPAPRSGPTLQSQGDGEGPPE